MDRAPIGRTLSLNPAFLETLSPQQLEGYVRVMAEASANHPGHDVKALGEVIEQGLHRLGISIAPVELERTAEQLVGHGQAPLTISTHDGVVLFERVGHSSLPPTPRTHVDPADPDRPTIS